MTASDPKSELRDYLQRGRDALLWKLDGLSEYDVRRPMTPTGHQPARRRQARGQRQSGYLGDTFGRPPDLELPWLAEDAEPNADMWATADESRRRSSACIAEVGALGRHVAALPLDTIGRVPWWPPDRAETTCTGSSST